MTDALDEETAPMTDLAREIEELLPCGATCAPMAGCHTCRSRPAILAYVQRKLDEAKADGELLAKVQQYIDANPKGVSCAKSADTTTYIVWRIGTAWDERGPTLVEALRKLVGEDS